MKHQIDYPNNPSYILNKDNPFKQFKADKIMFKRVLIANRGEIALRGIRACHDLGIEAFAIYSDYDTSSLHVKKADKAIALNGLENKETYLGIEKIIHIAKENNCEAIFPGYGFLSENADFARACENNNLIFIGPTSDSIIKMGNKIQARAIMKQAGVPVKPGSDGPIKNLEEAIQISESAGYPIMIKTARGGGGKGIRVVYNSNELKENLDESVREAKNSFGENNSVFIEKYFEGGKHIEVQILGDSHGNIIHLGERECSVQRRYQKLLEESPSPSIDDALRQQIHRIGVNAAKAVNYRGAGTIELMKFDINGKSEVYFIEMNTRIQVEHPVTEMVTDIDIAQEMIRIAAGERLKYSQQAISLKGHAIECRINCEDPENNFMPSTGEITELKIPMGEGIRFDSHLYLGYIIPHKYDSLIGKLIVHAKDRTSCIDKMKSTLDNLIIEGVETTMPLHQRILRDHEFQDKTYMTNFIEQILHQIELEKKSLLDKNEVHYASLGSQGCYLHDSLVGIK